MDKHENERTISHPPTHLENISPSSEYEREKEKGERETREQEKEIARHSNATYSSVTSLTSEQYYCPNDETKGNRASSSFTSINQRPTINMPFSRTRARKTHYLDDSDEEILQDDIIEVTHYDHYPTLMERWGEDTKTQVRYEGDLKIEDYVEFEELEPTEIEEIQYEITFNGEQIQSCRPIHRCRSQRRNFQKIKKRRIKRKCVQTNTAHIDQRAGNLLDQMRDLSNQIDVIIRAGEDEMRQLHEDQGTIDSQFNGKSIEFPFSVRCFSSSIRLAHR